MAADSKASRCAIWFAIHDLKTRGYLTDRCCGKNRVFDIIAWNQDSVLGLIIRSARNQALTSFHDDIAHISALVQRNQTPGKTELWLYHPGGRSRYQILPGGAMLLREAK
ncbi:hypothetical protein KHC33_15290 [Methanospirillum sp. J.3.6.1-F.2.7.3]|uniref:Uncharacterized protein n=1 Tax=Methanospirillum purgamenti TaxID=2834276 RepID=A0A8E7EJ08_9EURY|nr:MULTISPECIES: hypothetical protein [Methanospirillum]MDX8548977.1 hypothetical protein [Methanospirillum hungatei]QVV88664.1 hypothetical protein KHC33_15290 [Methanospirillum sp. J.3.6.1-F.2.7.3]